METARKSSILVSPKPEIAKSDAGRLSDTIVKELAAPDRGNSIVYDRGNDAVRGFGIRVTASGAKAFVLNYTVAGRERRLTIGAYPAW